MSVGGTDRTDRVIRAVSGDRPVVSATTRIVLLRHGETEWNLERRIQGHLDSRLTERGREQALANGERLRRYFGDAGPPRLISSPLGRCRETTELICRVLGIHPSLVELDDRLKEHGYGDWEGRTKAELERDDPERFAAREADVWNVAVPSGESYSVVADRLSAWLADIDGQSVVAVSHGCAGRILRGIYASLPLMEIEMLGQAHDEIHLLADGRITLLD